MAKTKVQSDTEKTKKDNEVTNVATTTEETQTPSINDIGWTDHVLSLLTDDEKIAGNPTTDGLRRIFELALNCVVTQATSEVVQSPDPSNEKRATVVHTVSYILKNIDSDLQDLKYRTVSGAADVYWGNCDKVYRNHPVAVAETRAEGRALRRALKLRKVVAAEEIAASVEDHPDSINVSKISHNQINFIDVMSQRLNINPKSLIASLNYKTDNIYSLDHEQGVDIIKNLSTYQQNTSMIPDTILGYDSNWR